MPTLPSRQQQAIGTPQLRPGSFTQFQDQSGRQLQQAGRALEFAGGGLARLGDSIRVENDAARAKEAIKTYRAFAQGQLSPTEGFRSRRGKEAMDSYEATRNAFDMRRDSIASGLQNAEQRQLFLDGIEGTMRQSQSVMETHLAGQTRSYNLGETKASIDVEMDVYRDNLGDPMAAAESLARIRAHVGEYADVASFGPEQREALMRQTLEAAHTGAFDALMQEQDTEGARAYLNAHGSEMGAGIRRRAKGMLQKATRLETVMRVSDRMVDAGGTLTDMLDRVQELQQKGEISAEVRADVERRVEAAVLTRRREESVSAKQALDDAIQWVGTGAPLTPQMAQALEDSGESWKFDAYLNNGGAWRTTRHGFRKLFTISPAELMEFASREEVWDAFRSDLDDDNLAMMVGKWERAQAAAGRTLRDAAGAASGAKDAFSLNQDDHLMHLYRTLPEVDENLAKIDEDGIAQWDRYRVAVVEEANRMAGPGGTKTMELLRKAHEVVASEKLYLDGEARTAATLSGEQRQQAQVKTALGEVDINKMPTERLMAAEDKLLRKQRERSLAGLPAGEITQEAIYMQAQLDLDAENKAGREMRLTEREMGWARLGAAVVRLRNDPEFRKEWLVFGANGELRERVTRQKTDFFGNPKPGYGTETYTIPYSGTRESKFSEMVMRRLGRTIGEDFGIEDGEVEEQIRRMLGMSDEAVRGVYKTESATFGGGTAGAAAGVGAALRGMGQ